MDKIKQALEAVQHIFLCEDEGMASGQPTKEDYLEARELVAAALAELEGLKNVELTDAAAIVSERSKTSLMVGFSEEEIQRIVTDSIPPSAHVGLALTHEWAVTMARAFMEVGLRHANTRAVSIDRIMDKVASWESTWAVDPPEETPEGLRGMWNDLRQRLENIKPSNPDQ